MFFEGDDLFVREQLLQGEVDLAILSGAVREPGLLHKTFLKDSIVPVVSANHPLAKIKKIKLHDLHDIDFILFHPASAIRRQVEKRMRQIKPRLHVGALMELRSIESVLRSIEAGLGPGFLSTVCLNNNLKALQIEELWTTRVFSLAYRRHHRIGLALLMEEFKRCAQKMGGIK